GGFRARDVLFRRLVHAPGPRDSPSRLLGAGAADQVRATEASIHYLLNFEAGYSCGLFLDQRANRARLRSLAPARLLNLFAYTCSFSVCAALAGAETTSVDLSKAALERGRANFAANSLGTAGHRFLADDVFDVLPRLARRGEKFDAIIVDPPTFSRGRGGRIFRAAEGLAGLAELALACAAPGAHVLLSSNASAITTRHLAAIARKLGGSQLLAPPPLPDIPPSRAAAAIWFQAP
ncbi:MAG: class I SAM-dependent methyltransferase, partial [Terrimicrobiaceae bacterium]|nr:class I SAM-dependent methyltransferase [Terrimicrobiaceae bacterium]